MMLNEALTLQRPIYSVNYSLPDNYFQFNSVRSRAATDYKAACDATICPNPVS